MTKLQDLHADEQNDAGLEEMIQLTREGLAESGEQKTRSILIRILVKGLAENLVEKGIPEAIGINAEFGSRLLVKLAQARNELKQ